MNDDFDALVQKTFYTLMEFKPDFASYLGLHEYDTRMPSPTRETHLIFIETLKDSIEQFRAIPEGYLSKDRRIDQKLMIYILKNHIFEEDKIRRWEKDPDVVDILGHALFPLFAREFAPFEERLERITARVAKIPRYIKEFKTAIGTPVQLWVDMAREACSDFPLFLQAICAAAQQRGLDTTELEDGVAKTKDALSGYVSWLDTVPCEGNPALGRSLFEELLQVREIGLTADEILELGEMYLTQEKKNLEKLRSHISFQDTNGFQKESQKYTFEDEVNDFQKAITETRNLVKEREFATLPKNERLIVMETPSFLRHVIPGAACFPPAKFEEEQVGFYFLTPPEGEVKRREYRSILNVSVHEGYPGHHLQVTWANENPSLVRALSDAPEFVEGWAHYCEEKMRDYGLDDVEFQAIQSGYIFFRAARIIIDVRLQRGEMTVDQGISFLKSEVGMNDRIAAIEVKRYTKTPGQPLSYLIGKHLLLQVQKKVKEHFGEKYSDKKFHDAVLQAGSIPFPYLREDLKLKGML